MTPDATAAAAEQTLAELRRQRGAARLDGATFDNALVDRAAAEADALSEAEAEADSRRRATAATANAKRIDQLCEQLLAAEHKRLAAVNRAEAAARTMSAAVDEALAAAHDVAALCAQLGSPAPPASSRTLATISGGLAALLSRPGDGNRASEFGFHVRLKLGHHRPEAHWAQGANLTEIIERGKWKGRTS